MAEAGIFSPMLLIGFLLFALGFGIYFIILGRHGGLRRSRTFKVLFDKSSSLHAPAAASDRRWLKRALVMMGLGAVLCFGSVASFDRAQRKACEAACAEKGLAKGRIGPSGTRTPQGRATRGCWCGKGEGAVEIPMP